jgi:hypothetical protein
MIAVEHGATAEPNLPFGLSRQVWLATLLLPVHERGGHGQDPSLLIGMTGTA